MTKEEFLALPPSIQARVLFDELATDLAAVTAPTVTRSPKYDFKVYGKGGYTWASEMTLDDLNWHLKRARESAASGGQWAEKDAKKARNLSLWATYRDTDPYGQVTTTRGEEVVAAATPKRFAQKHESGPAVQGFAKEPWDE